MLRLACPCCFLFFLPLAARADLPAGLKEAQALQEAFQKAIEEAEPSIACILVSRSDGYREYQKASAEPGKLGGFDIPRGMIDEKRNRLDLADPTNIPESFGSGVVIDESGLILTHYHVVRDATKVFVRLPGSKGSYADIHAADPRSDFAVLKLLNPPAGLKAIAIGDGGKVKKGQWVLTLANPFAAGFRDGSPSASWGIISNLRRRAPGSTEEKDQIKKTLHHFGTLIQTDARLNLGCSGGALLDLKGELIGLTTAVAALQGTEAAGGYAVPMDAGMRRIIEVLKRGEEVEYGFLGVNLIEDARRGAQINAVLPWSPAQYAGLRAGDLIVTVNGTPVREHDDLFLAIGTVLAGAEARIEVRRGGSVQTLTATLAKFYVPGPIIASRKPQAVRGLRVDHASVLQTMPSHFNPQQGIRSGVVIREVQPGSAAANALLKVYDLVTHVNGRAVHSPADFYREAQKVQGPLELTIDAARVVKVN